MLGRKGIWDVEILTFFNKQNEEFINILNTCHQPIRTRLDHSGGILKEKIEVLQKLEQFKMSSYSLFCHNYIIHMDNLVKM